MNDLDKKLLEQFEGKVVRKDLTMLVKGNASVPTYVLEYLLGQHCSTSDEEIIKHGVESVKGILSKHFVHRDEAERIKSDIREKRDGYKIIDSVRVRLNDTKDQYEADFSNLNLKNIPIADSIVRSHKKLLANEVWSIIDMNYMPSDERGVSPWIIGSLKPIQISNIFLNEFKEARKNFTADEWIDILMQSIGLNPEEFNRRTKLIQLARLIPFVENNYNLVELGPKGTGKSHIYSELSPHGILLSGGKVSEAKLFVNNATGEIGLVGYWDVVAYDEFAGRTKRVDQGLVDVLKNYMSNKTFSRGKGVIGATASMAFVGNTDRSVQYMIKQSDLFEALPKAYYDSAFLDRMYTYLPGWEVEKLRNEMFTDGYGFIVDYLAEILKELRKEDRTNDYADYFELSDTITTRDKMGITKTFSGFLKIIYPGMKPDLEEVKDLFEFAIEGRRRVKVHISRFDETFEEVDFSYSLKGKDEFKHVYTLEEEEFGTSENIYSEQADDAREDREGEKPVEEKPLQGKHIDIKDNIRGYSFRNLFGDYLKGVKRIEVVDPYIRYPHQVRNFMELMDLIIQSGDIVEGIEVKLTTYNEPEFEERSVETFTALADSLEKFNVKFEFELTPHIHDRYILVDDNWKILLGRGLDIWQKPAENADISTINQLLRRCKATSITILGKDEF